MLDPNDLKEEALNSLLGIIDAIHGNKVLVLDKALLSTLSTVTSFSTLKEHGIKHIVWLQSSNLTSVADIEGTSAVIYLCSSSSNCANVIADHVKTLVKLPKSLDLNLILAPEKTLAFSHVLEENSILGDLTIQSWPVYFLPFNEDVLTLNIPSGGFRDTYLDGLTSSIYLAAEAIQDLQQRCGLIGRITGKGDAAYKLAELLIRNKHSRRTDLADDDDSTVDEAFDHRYSNIFIGTSIDQIVIVDRQTDLLTPLLTQLTYLGLIDEFYRVSDFGQVELPAAIVNPPQPNKSTSRQPENSRPNISAEKKAALLSNGKNDLFHTIRDSNFAIVGQSLNKVARQLQSDYEQRHEAKTVSQIKEFVSKLGGLQTVHQSLRFHTALAEELMTKVQGEEFNKWLEIQQNLVADSLDLTTIHNMIEDLIGRQSNLSMILRLLAIESLCNGGIKPKDLQFFKREIIQSYGYEHILTLEKLEQLGLIQTRSPQVPNNFPQLRRLLNLVTEQDDDPNEPKDISFTYSGYAPLSVRLVQCVINKSSVLKPKRFQIEQPQAVNGTGWKGAEEILKHIPGPSFDEIQRSEENVREGKLRNILIRNSNKALPTTLVFYLGGITYAEIAALRFISQSASLKTNLMIATTGIISGDKIADIACDITQIH